MRTADEAVHRPVQPPEENRAPSNQWRALRRAATAVAQLTAPAVLFWLRNQAGWSVGWSVSALLGALSAPQPGWTRAHA